MGGPGTLRKLTGSHQVRHLARTIDQLFPQLTGRYRITYYWTGEVALTVDHLPHLHDFGSGVYAFVGCNGRGLALSTAAGGLLAKLASGVDPKLIPFPIVSMKTLPAYAQYPVLFWGATIFYQLQHMFPRPSQVRLENRRIVVLAHQPCLQLFPPKRMHQCSNSGQSAKIAVGN